MKYTNNRSNLDISVIEKGYVVPPNSYYLTNINEIDKIHDEN